MTHRRSWGLGSGLGEGCGRRRRSRGGGAPGGVGEVAATSTVLSRLRATRERRRGCGEEAGRGGARRFGGGVDARGDTVTRVGGVASAPDPDRVVGWGRGARDRGGSGGCGGGSG